MSMDTHTHMTFRGACEPTHLLNPSDIFPHPTTALLFGASDQKLDLNLAHFKVK